MSSRTIIGLLVGLSTAAAACGSDPASTSRPRTIVGSGGTTGTATGGTGNVSSGNAAGTTVVNQGGTTSVAGTDSGLGGTVSAAAGTTGTAGTGPMVDPCVPIDSLKALPMAVDGPFIPGGYFADMLLPANLTGIVHAACETRPDAATHYGSCHKWSFTPSDFGMDKDPVSGLPSTYGGVFWLAGAAANWGTAAGENVAPGAMTVKFRAWGAVGGEAVSFNVGGVIGTTCLDSVNLGPAGMLVTLTTMPTDYVISLQQQTYPKGVIGGFSWSAQNTSLTVPVSFYVDDIRWTADAT